MSIEWQVIARAPSSKLQKIIVWVRRVESSRDSSDSESKSSHQFLQPVDFKADSLLIQLNQSWLNPRWLRAFNRMKQAVVWEYPLISATEKPDRQIWPTSDYFYPVLPKPAPMIWHAKNAILKSRPFAVSIADHAVDSIPCNQRTIPNLPNIERSAPPPCNPTPRSIRRNTTQISTRDFLAWSRVITDKVWCE